MTDHAPCCWREIHDWGEADAGRCEGCLVMDYQEVKAKLKALLEAAEQLLEEDPDHISTAPWQALDAAVEKAKEPEE